MRGQRRNERGISILELLIVTGIIGLLTLLALPTYRTVMFKVQRTRMLAQLNTLMNDESLYQRDHGRYYPKTVQYGSWAFGWRVYPPDQPLLLEGQNVTLPGGSQQYAYFIYRFEPYFKQPLIYAYANRFYGNDLDGDLYPDLWVKVGHAPAQLYMDDLTNTTHPINW